MFKGARMASEQAIRRVRVLQTALSGHKHHGVRIYSTASGDGKVVAIGDVSMSIKTAEAPELVPKKYKVDRPPQSLMRHLRWVMQKDSLGQDVFLIGPPGPLRRNIAMMYLELTNREVEYVSLSRDTTESDLKQRREIKSGSAFYIDQCAVKAATEGRVLILEGIEKAERNVLPVLNNLLENREMQLDDGRFLMAAQRYDKLLKEHSQAELDEWKIVRVDESFRVIALGLPVPRYRGNPLDPPLRSRFQARDINPLPFQDHLQLLTELGPAVPADKLLQILSFASTMKSDEAISLGLPDFPTDNVAALVKIMNAVPSSSPERLLQRLYPYDVMLSKEGQTAVTDALKRFELRDVGATGASGQINEVVRSTDGGATVHINTGRQQHAIQVSSGTRSISSQAFEEQAFVHTTYHDQLLSDMMQSHLVADFCIIGPRGCGKSVLSRRFADLLGYHVEPIMLYQDMTARDLLQQRMTLPNGDTAWRPSPLITAATEGRLAVLDGVHRVNAGTFAVLQRLIHDRELSLFDGSRLLRKDRYDEIKEENGYTDEVMREKGILAIHPSFRIVALSEPPVVGGGGGPQSQWLSAELLTMFLFHNMRPLSRVEETHVLSSLVPNMGNMQTILDLTHRLRDSHDTNLKSVASSFSTRQLFRIARRLSVYPDENLYDTVQKACLGRFLPRLARTALEEELEQIGLKKSDSAHSIDSIDRSMTCEIKDNVLRIGNTTAPVFNPDNKMKVPDVLFYENPQHLSVMEDMLKDFLLGEHLLLVGNQGVGKNKIVDRFLYLLNRPREYLQLHRDTTVQTLTLQPTVQDGVIRYEDSPLVRAVKSGHVLMVDEADKAPTNVTCILKTLVESGEMHLADGRRVVSAHSGIPASDSVIVAHPNFHMIILANRPGFPFLGNDFFGAMGDIYSCHAVDNPDPESEMSMLRRYGPHVDEEMLRKLVMAFGELRDMADQGLITYPYSTREVVNMVKHLEMYPGEGLANVVKNVFDFDSYNKEVKETIVGTLHKHGIPVGADPRNVNLAKEFPLPGMQKIGKWSIADQGFRQKTSLMALPVEDRTLRVTGSVHLAVQSFPLERVEARSILFSEQEAHWSIPIHETSIISSVTVTKGATRSPGKLHPDIIHVTTAAPLSLYSMDPRAQKLTCIDLYDVFPQARRVSSSQPRVQVVPLGFPLHNIVIVHEEISNTILSINYETGEMNRIETTTFLEEAANKVSRTFRANQGQFKVCGTFATDPDGMLLRYKKDGQSIEVLNMLEGRCHAISVPIRIGSLHMVSRYDWLLQEADTGMKFMLTHTKENPFEFKLQPVAENDGLGGSALGQIENIASVPLHDALLSGALEQNIESPNRVLATRTCYGAIALGMPDLSSFEIHTSPRIPLDDTRDPSDRWANQVTNVNDRALKSNVPVVYLPECGQIVRALPTWQVPTQVFPDGVKPKGVSGYLEVSDMVHKKLRYMPVPGVINQSHYGQWYSGDSSVGIVMAAMSNDGLVTVDTGGCIRLWETSLVNLDKSMRKWQGMIGDGESQPLELEYKDTSTEPTAPKHGRVDPTGNPHTGGGQWAGGTGGSNTAGLGGRGGPYRLDAGHDVTQIPDWQKEQVPQEVQQAAREMGLKAWKERLKEIKMSEFDGEMYKSFRDGVKAQIKSMRNIIESLQAKGKEREWLKHQTYGDLDEAKLIEGLTGEKAIYRRRGEKEPELGAPQQKPKLVRLLVDVSGSMYRFNGYDGRLNREMEAMLMVMESFENYEDKLKYEIIGHSGEGYKFDMVTGDKPPKNNKERLDVIKTLHAHAQFCMSGDHTVEATKHAIQTITDEEADEHFVIVLSDANLDRYGIRPKAFADVLTANDDVNAYVIFIGSLGNQATSLIKQMPSGRAYLCMDTKNLPQILQQIFTSTMLNTS